jgi:hypothetical protein
MVFLNGTPDARCVKLRASVHVTDVEVMVVVGVVVCVVLGDEVMVEVAVVLGDVVMVVEYDVLACNGSTTAKEQMVRGRLKSSLEESY